MTPTKTKKSPKQLRKEEKERENHIKNVSKNISEKYLRSYNESNSQLKKINLDFELSNKLSCLPVLENKIKALSGLYIYPRIYATLIEGSENLESKIKEIEKGVTPEILFKSIMLPFFESQGEDVNKIIIKKNTKQPNRYDLIDESGRVIYIKLHTKNKVDNNIKPKSVVLLKYLNNKDYFDGLIFDEYIEQFKKGFDSYIKSLKTKISIKKPDNDPVLEEGNPKGKELRIVLCKTPGFYGVALEYGQPDQGHAILYSVPKDAGLRKMTNTIMKTIPEIQSYCESTGRDIFKIPINNKGFDEKYFNYFEKKFKKLFEK